MAKAPIICIVEDEKDIRDALQMLFEQEGYRVKTAPNGREALKVVNSLPDPLVLLVDLMMPIMNGWELIEAIRKKYSKTNIPIIAMSAVDDRIHTIFNKIDAFIRKPINLEELLNLVANKCSREEKIVV